MLNSKCEDWQTRVIKNQIKQTSFCYFLWMIVPLTLSPKGKSDADSYVSGWLHSLYTQES